MKFQGRVGDTYTMTNGTPTTPGAIPFPPFTFTSYSPCTAGNGQAGMGAIDPDFHSQLILVTDPCTEANAPGTNFDVGETNNSTDIFSSDASMFLILKDGAPRYYYLNAPYAHANLCSPPGSWNGGTLCILKSNIVGKAAPTDCGGGGVGVNCTQTSTGGITFSGNITEPNVIYETSVSGLIVYKDVICRNLPAGQVDLICTSKGGTTGVDTFARTVYFNFADPVYGTLPSDYNMLWSGSFGISNDGSMTVPAGGAGSYQTIADSSGNTCSTTHCTLTLDTFILPPPSNPAHNNTRWVITGNSISGSSPTYSVTFTFTPAGDTIPNPPTTPHIVITGSASSNCAGTWPVSSWSTPGGGPYSVTATVTYVGTLSTCGTVSNIGYADTAFQASSGATGGTEPNWMSTCQTQGDTCTDGSVTWTNIGNLNGQGPGFDLLEYGPPGSNAPGFSRLNTRLAKVYRGHNQGINYPASGASQPGQAYTPSTGYGAGTGTLYTNEGLLCQQYGNTSDVANTSGTSITSTVVKVYNSTIAAAVQIPGVPATWPWGGTLVTIKNMTPSAYNGSFLVTGGDGATYFTYSVSSNVGAITVLGTSNAPPASGICGTNIPFTEYFTIHDVGTLVDSTYTQIAPTGGGSNPPQFYYSPPTTPQCLDSNNNYRGQWISTPNPAYAVHDAVYGLSDPANLYSCTTAATCASGGQPSGNAAWTGNSNVGAGNVNGPSYCYTYTWTPADNIINSCMLRGGNYGFGACTAHSIHGYLNEWKGGPLYSHLYSLFTKNGFANPGVAILPLTNTIPGDTHGTDRGALPDDSNPVQAANTDVPATTYSVVSVGGSVQTAGYNEFIGLFPDGSANTGTCIAPSGAGAGTGCFQRFAHSYNDGINPTFSGQNNIGTVSQNGAWALWGVDIMGTRGSTKAALWTAGSSTKYPVGTPLYPTSNNNRNMYEWIVTSCSGTCTSGTTEPVWDGSTTTITDGTITWTREKGSCNNPLSQNNYSSAVSRFAPGNVTMNTGDVMYPLNANYAIFVATSCTGGCPQATGAGAVPTWLATCGSYGQTCTYGNVVLTNVGPNTCRSDAVLIDLMSAH